MAGPTLPLAREIFQTKYANGNESFEQAMHRIADALADDREHYNHLFKILVEQRFLPAGRIMASMGSARATTAYNCFVSGTIEDSMSGIMQRAMEAAQTMRMGGGIGYDFSTLRPRGDLIRSLDSHSSGPISFMGIFNSVCNTIASAGHRRGAQMGVLRVDHPDIEEFVHAKQNTSNLTAFNISVGVTDEFMDAVRGGREFALRFGDRTYKTVDARRLWDEIMRSTWDWAEPGVLFIDRINALNNLQSHGEVISATNPCCVPYTSRILTDQGYITIGSVVGQSVRIWNGREWSSVKPFHAGRGAIYKVTLSNGVELECTPNHRFLLDGGVFKEANQLSEGDRLSKEKMPTVGKVESKDHNLAYSQGFYSGDGSEGRNKSFLYEPKYVCASKLVGTIGREHASRKFKMWYHGPMEPKRWVPLNLTDTYGLNWLAGLFDADACITRNIESDNLQFASVDYEFIQNVRLLLTRFGVQAHIGLMHDKRVASLPDGHGNYAEYNCQSVWRLCINATDLKLLVEQGFSPVRLAIRDFKVQRDARRFVTVIAVEDTGRTEDVYCFTEPLRGLGTFEGIVTGNSEQPLPPHGACLLGSWNLTRMRWQIDDLAKDIAVVVRAMDNVIDRTIYPLPAQEYEAKQKRRMGLGVTGLANAIEGRGVTYGDDRFIAGTDLYLQVLMNLTYKASALLAAEKGSFPALQKDKYINAPFIMSLAPEVRNLIAKHGIRNSHLLSIAPTGTISLVADNVSSGIEPVFALEYDRTVQTPGGPRVERVADWGMANRGVRGKVAGECTTDDHLRVLLGAQKYVDSAVSKTVNVGSGVTFEEFKDIYTRAYDGGAKGLSTFRIDGKRAGILNATTPAVQGEGDACAWDPATGNKTCDQ